LAASPSLAETPVVSADSFIELWPASVLDANPLAEQLFTAAEPLMVTNFFGHEVFMPTTSIRACTPAEEASCGCSACIFIFPSVRCFC
jgi:hypothetical protein